MRTTSALLLLLLLLEPSLALAAIRPSFSLEDCAWMATDIVVATEGQTIDGKLEVVDVWHGDLKPGQVVSVPELAAFAPEAARGVPSWTGKDQVPALYVSGKRMILFLKKPQEGSGKWLAASRFGGMDVSVLWIEPKRTYGIVQVENPGPAVLFDLNKSEEELKAVVKDTTETRSALTRAAAIADLAQRANLLRPFVDSKHWYARRMAFAELGKSGPAALPVLRTLLADDAHLPQHTYVVTALGQAGGAAVGPELTKLVETETAFWREKAPKLESGWWNGTGITRADVEPLRNRYGRLLSELRALKQLKYDGCRTAVVNLRDFWRSLPQLEDRSGLNQMSETCDEVLKSLGQTKGKET